MITSTCKTIKDSLCIYAKIPEIRNNKWRYPDYYNNFSMDFLNNNNNILRFERRMQSSKDIKKAFHLDSLKSVTLTDIFDSNVNVVTEKVQKLFM